MPGRGSAGVELRPRTIPTRAIVGVVQVVRCAAAPVDDPDPWAFNDPGVYHWWLAHQFWFAEPVPCNGAQGIWEVREPALAAGREAFVRASRRGPPPAAPTPGPAGGTGAAGDAYPPGPRPEPRRLPGGLCRLRGPGGPGLHLPVGLSAGGPVRGPPAAAGRGAGAGAPAGPALHLPVGLAGGVPVRGPPAAAGRRPDAVPDPGRRGRARGGARGARSEGRAVTRVDLRRGALHVG